MKPQLRKMIQERLEAIDPRHIQARSLEVCRRLIDQPEFRSAQVVMAFVSIDGEVDTGPILDAAWAARKRVLVPRVDWASRQMLAMEIRSVELDIRPSRFGLREPDLGAPFPAGDIDLIIAPGLAFDRMGRRLGRGGGYYDRFLSRDDIRATTCAIAFEEQLVEEVPTDAHDVSLNMLVTDREVLRFQAVANEPQGDVK